MKRTDFDYHLPAELIAQRPLGATQCQSSVVFGQANGSLDDRKFSELPGLLNPGDLLVFNNTKVIPARLYGLKASGGRIEILVERLLSQQECLAQVRASKSPKPGGMLVLEDGSELQVLGGRTASFHLQSADADLMACCRILVICRCRPTSRVKIPRLTGVATRRCLPRHQVRWQHLLRVCTLIRTCWISWRRRDSINDGHTACWCRNVSAGAGG